MLLTHPERYNIITQCSVNYIPFSIDRRWTRHKSFHYVTSIINLILLSVCYDLPYHSNGCPGRLNYLKINSDMALPSLSVWELAQLHGCRHIE